VTYSKPARGTARRIRIRKLRFAGLLVAIAAIAVIGQRLQASSSSTVVPPKKVLRTVPNTVWPAYGQAAFVQA